MRLSRHDTGELARLEAAQMAKNSAEEVLHPPGSTPRFATPAKLKQAWADEQIVAFPQNERVTGLRADAHMGELGAPPTLYQGLRPEALATALYIGAEVRAISKRVAADRHLDRARRRLPAPARGPQPRGDPQLLAPHHGLGVRHRARVIARRRMRWRSSSSSTACRCSTRSRGFGSPAPST